MVGSGSPQFMVGSVLAGFTLVYGGVRVGWVHLSLWWGPCWLGSPQFMVGSVLAGFTSVYGGVRVAHLFSFLCCVVVLLILLLLLFVFGLCLVYQILPLFLDFPFFIAPFGFL